MPLRRTIACTYITITTLEFERRMMNKTKFERRRLLQLTLLGSLAVSVTLAGCSSGHGYRPPPRLRRSGSQHDDKPHRGGVDHPGGGGHSHL